MNIFFLKLGGGERDQAYHRNYLFPNKSICICIFCFILTYVLLEVWEATDSGQLSYSYTCMHPCAIESFGKVT